MLRADSSATLTWVVGAEARKVETHCGTSRVLKLCVVPRRMLPCRLGGASRSACTARSICCSAGTMWLRSTSPASVIATFFVVRSNSG